MMTQSWMYDAFVYIYALSLLFYFSDFVMRNRDAKLMGTGLLVFVWMLQTLFFAMRALNDPHFMTSIFDSLLFFSWLTVTLSLLITLVTKLDLLVFFVNLAGFAVAALNLFSDERNFPALGSWRIQNDLLMIHISLAIASYVAFLTAAILSAMYWFLHRRLKAKKWTKTMQRLPSLEKIEKGTFTSIMLGTPLLILSLALGIVWIIIKGDATLIWDPKVINSILIIGAYAWYLVLRVSRKTPGNRLALWNMAAFMLVLLNYVVSNDLSRFHQWLWK